MSNNLYEFPFGLNQKVRIKLTGEEGIVTALVVYRSGTKAVNLEYKKATGNFAEKFIDVEHLEAV